MTAREYLRKAIRLDARIDSDIEEAARLREMATSLQSPGFEEHYGSNHPTEAPFARHVERLIDLERHINTEIDALVELKEEVRHVIDMVDDPNERMVLRYRYILNHTWDQIGEAMHASERTVRRWHGMGLRHIKVPTDNQKLSDNVRF